MRMYFAGGFLGSGKTTAIAGACRSLIDSGRRVGVVTNDQGKLQVDSLFMRSAGFPTVEVGGGCFCCNYDDFDAKLAGLIERDRPEFVFAESVGSCADIVATVVKPFETFRETYGDASVFSVFADSRLLLARLSGTTLPFSEDILYIFDSQLAEADLLVLNKRDLLGEAEAVRLQQLAVAAWPRKRLLTISGSTPEGAASWLAELDAASAGPSGLGRERLELDYARYGAGEGELGWLDERLLIEDSGGLSSDGGRCRQAVLDFVLAFAGGLSSARLPVGHLKVHVSAGAVECKLSLTSADFLQQGAAGGLAASLRSLVEAQLPQFSARRATVAVNARVQVAPEELAALASAAAASARSSAGLEILEEDRSAFRPGLPVPTHRL